MIVLRTFTAAAGEGGSFESREELTAAVEAAQVAELVQELQQQLLTIGAAANIRLRTFFIPKMIADITLD